MDTNDYAIEEIFSETRRFMVPLYQRKFQWDDRRILPFWEDVKLKATEVLEDDRKFQHYMGALILAPIDVSSQIGVTPRVQVVDGQQRLTTFQIFLTALREVARENTRNDIIDNVKDYLFNPLKSKDTDPSTKFKLTPTPSDRTLFHDILDNDYSYVRTKYASYYWGNRVPKNTPLKALRAYEVFKQYIDHFSKYGPSDTDEYNDSALTDEVDTSEVIESRLDALLQAILNYMKLVVITLGEGDDAQVIFETLNSKGEPLLAMDLVRNNIFHRAEKQGASIEELYKELWDPFDASWWREPAPNARPTRPRIDHFLAHVLVAETGEKISVRELYAEYRNFVMPKRRPRFTNVQEELRLLERHAPTYETLEGNKDVDPTLTWLGRKLATWQVTTAYPVALQIADSEIEPDEREIIAQLIYSYIVRRALCDLRAKNLNKIFQSISQHFIKFGTSASALVKFFEGRSGENTRFPSDDEFRRGILYKPAYQLAPSVRIKDILWELEVSSRSHFAEKIDEMPSSLWTEHVLPRSWDEEWPFQSDDVLKYYSDDSRAVERNRVLHTLGNLTLLTDKLNISSGKKNFSEKKKNFAEHSSLFINKWFLNYSSWAEPEILERGEFLSKKAVKIWIGLKDA